MNAKLLFFPLSIIILIWSVIGYTKPAWDNYKTKKTEVAKLVKEKQKLEQGIANIEKALLTYNNLDGDTKTYVNNAIPSEEEHDNLIAEINKDASQSGILVFKSSFGKNRAKSKCSPTKIDNNKNDKNVCPTKASSTNVTLSVMGNYLAIRTFLEKLDHQNRIIIPNSISLAVSNKNKDKEEKGASNELLTAKIQFNVLHKKPTKIKSFSAVLSTDKVLKSLLNKGLDNVGLQAVDRFVNSDVFIPVYVEGVGKEDLFANGPTEAVQNDVDNNNNVDNGVNINI